MTMEVNSVLIDEQQRISEILIKDASFIESQTEHANCQKNAESSIEYLTQANEIYQNKIHNANIHEEAWVLYSKSIAFAPTGSEELASSYERRSALLSHLCKYEACVSDVDRAMRITSCESLKLQLLLRKLECAKALDNTETVNITTRRFKAILKRSKLNVEGKKKFEVDFESVIAKAKKVEPEHDKRNSSLTFTVSKKIPCASEALAIRSSEKFGVHIVATRKIRPGEILALEKPFVALPHTSKLHSHCWHCLKSEWASIPCDNCAHAIFCSEECKNEALIRYHDIECPVVPYLWNLDSGDAGMVRIFVLRQVILGLKEAGSIKKLHREITRIENCQDRRTRCMTNGIYRSDSFKSVYCLMDHIESRTSHDVQCLSTNAAVTLHALANHTTLFGEDIDAKPEALAENNEALYIGALIGRLQYVMDINAHLFYDDNKLCECDVGDECMEVNSQHGDIGQSLSPFCSLLNHSCNPNVQRCRIDKGMVIFALRPIEKGDQIFDSYGPQYFLMLRTDRQVWLDTKYHFDCDCTSCQEDWPLLNNLPSDLVKKIMNTNTTSPNRIKEIGKVLEMSFATVRLVNEGKIDYEKQALKNLVRVIETIAKYASLPYSAESQAAIDELGIIFTQHYGIKFEIPEKCSQINSVGQS